MVKLWSKQQLIRTRSQFTVRTRFLFSMEPPISKWRTFWTSNPPIVIFILCLVSENPIKMVKIIKIQVYHRFSAWVKVQCTVKDRWKVQKSQLIILFLFQASFGITTFSLSVYIAQTDNIPNPNVLDWNGLLRHLSRLDYCLPHQPSIYNL